MKVDELLDLYFLDARCKLIEIAAFLDRIDRASRKAPQGKSADYRLEAFRKALRRVAGAAGEKAKAAQLAFSDPTTEPLASAAGMKGASGAWPGKRRR